MAEQPQPEVNYLTDEQCMITNPYVKGMDLCNKKWFKHKNAANVDVDFLEGEEAGACYTLEPGDRGHRLIRLVAEECRVPLYSTSANDPGTSPEKADAALTGAFECCARWNAILLPAEADMFRSERTLEALHRNELGSRNSHPVFLRRIDHYRGTSLLMTNRIAAINQAFEPRIDLIIPYQDLTVEARKVVWASFLSHNWGIERFDMSAIELVVLAGAQVNSHEIKNLVQNALIMNVRKGGKVGFGDRMRLVDMRFRPQRQ
ncbi:hypothetical protein DL764_001178 [Monosporascus ibericus]|uniref:ATPase AAA-type core domain-containing protein n=1 Tax=Monosporascus ibericus TaxID=155417 RepID=A0A4Q4TQN6_9PEZI|nr:hypothetical protein DL764_001178 [Monosporascus ibericus]